MERGDKISVRYYPGRVTGCLLPGLAGSGCRAGSFGGQEPEDGTVRPILKGKAEQKKWRLLSPGVTRARVEKVRWPMEIQGGFDGLRSN
jgi:hypothetical protein